MNDVSVLKINDVNYNIKDKTARDSADTALNTANSTNTKLDNTKVVSSYDSATEELTISLQIGGE